MGKKYYETKPQEKGSDLSEDELDFDIWADKEYDSLLAEALSNLQAEKEKFKEKEKKARELSTEQSIEKEKLSLEKRQKTEESTSALFGLLAMCVFIFTFVQDRGDENIVTWVLGNMFFMGGAFILSAVCFYGFIAICREMLTTNQKNLLIAAAVIVIIILIWAGTNNYGSEPVWNIFPGDGYFIE